MKKIRCFICLTLLILCCLLFSSCTNNKSDYSQVKMVMKEPELDIIKVELGRNYDNGCYIEYKVELILLKDENEKIKKHYFLNYESSGGDFRKSTNYFIAREADNYELVLSGMVFKNKENGVSVKEVIKIKRNLKPYSWEIIQKDIEENES